MSDVGRDRTGVLMEDPFWEMALRELNAGKRQAELWARCLAQAKGNQSLAEMQYLRDRAGQLAAELRDEERRLKEASEKAHLSQAMRIVESLPRGRCSNCEAVILLSARTCPKCLVAFGDASGAKILPLDRPRA